MARRRKAGVYGPYQHGWRWRVHVVNERGETTCSSFATRQEAERVVRLSKRELARAVTKTLCEAIEEYEMFLRRKECKQYAETVRRLHTFFADPELPISSLNPIDCAAYYKALTERVSERTGKPFAVASHQNMLVDAKTFGAWCVSNRWLHTNPLKDVKPIGKRKHGKPQLHVDEARKWLAKASELAQAGEDGAVAAMMTLLMGMRCSEIISRQVRDLDDDGKLLWITRSKTDAGVRYLETPALIRPHLLRLAKDRNSEELLFGYHWRDWPRTWVEYICEKSGVMRVSAHAMRGLHSTLAIAAGSTSHVVAASLGHTSFQTTLQSYADPSAMPLARQRAALTVLTGGK